MLMHVMYWDLKNCLHVKTNIAESKRTVNQNSVDKGQIGVL